MIGAIIAMNIALEAQRRATEAKRKREAEDERCRTGNVQGYTAGADVSCRIGICVIRGAEAGLVCRIGEI